MEVLNRGREILGKLGFLVCNALAHCNCNALAHCNCNACSARARI